MILLPAFSRADNEVKTLTQDYEKTKQSLEKAELKQRQVLSALYQLNKKIKRSVTERGKLSQQKSLLEVNINTLSDKVQDLGEKSGSQKARLAERLRAIYKLGGASLARFLVSSSNSATLERNLKVLGVVAARDLELIKTYRQDLKDLERQKRTLALRLEGLNEVEQKIAKQESALRNEQNLKNKLLDGIRKSKLFALSKIQDLREKSLKFNIEDAGVFDLLFKPSFADQKGTLPMPLEGAVMRKFGLMKDEDHPYTLTHKGVFISAAKGSPIKSVFDGRVSYVGPLPGFGTTLIVDHGDHYYSVYAHAEEVKVQLGDEIAQAQVIANVGHSVQEATPGLYFEIRHFSEPYDPQQWTKGL